MEKCTSKLSCGSTCEACAIYSPMHYQSAIAACEDLNIDMNMNIHTHMNTAKMNGNEGHLTETPQPVTFRGTFAFDHVFYRDARIEVTPGGICVFGKRGRTACFYEAEDVENIHIIPENHVNHVNNLNHVVTKYKKNYRNRNRNIYRWSFHMARIRACLPSMRRAKQEDKTIHKSSQGSLANIVLEFAEGGTVGVLVDSPREVKDAIIEAINIQY